MSSNQPNSENLFVPPLRGGVHIIRAREFVNRELLLNNIFSQVEIMKHGGIVHDCVSNVNGVPGIGKSAFLGAIADATRTSSQIRVVEIDMVQVYPSRLTNHDLVDEGFTHETGASPRLHFLQSIMRWLDLSADEYRDTFFDYVSQLTPDSSDEALDAALSVLSELLAALPQPILLIIDSWDAVPDIFPPWFERVFLLPLVRRNRVIAVFGSQNTMRWWQFEIRHRARAITLEPLKKEESIQQIGCSPEQSDLMYSITHGYPLANEYLYTALPQFSTSQIFEEAQPQIMRDILDQLQNRVITQISGELARVLQVMTLFREFDLSTLRAILPQFYSEFELRSQSSLMMSLKELLATRLVSWNDQLRAYQFEPTIRRIYSKAIRVTHPILYEEIRKAALNYYLSLIDDNYESGTIFLVEYCYHSLCRSSNPFSSEFHILGDSLISLFERIYTLRIGQNINSELLLYIVHRLEIDVEIQEALFELDVPSGWFTQLTNVLKIGRPDNEDSFL